MESLLKGTVSVPGGALQSGPVCSPLWIYPMSVLTWRSDVVKISSGAGVGWGWKGVWTECGRVMGEYARHRGTGWHSSQNKADPRLSALTVPPGRVQLAACTYSHFSCQFSATNWQIQGYCYYYKYLNLIFCHLILCFQFSVFFFCLFFSCSVVSSFLFPLLVIG